MDDASVAALLQRQCAAQDEANAKLSGIDSALLGIGSALSSLAAATAEHFAGCTNVVFVPWALADHDGYVSAMNDSSLSGDVALAGLHEAADPAAAIAEAAA